MPIINQVVKGGGTTPTGTMGITSNGVYNVTDYASADVQVPTTGPDVYIPRSLEVSGNDIIFSGKNVNETMISTDTATKVGKYAFAYAFYDTDGTKVPSISMPSVTEVMDYAFYWTYAQSNSVQWESVPTFSAPNLTTVGEYAFNHAFGYNAPFEVFDFSSVTTVGAYAFNLAFGYNTQSVNFNGITSLSNVSNVFSDACRNTLALTDFKMEYLQTMSAAGYCFNNCFRWDSTFTTHTGNLAISFPRLRTIENSSSGFAYLAQGNKNVVSISFDALESITNSNGCFNYLAYGANYDANNSMPSISFPSLKTIDSTQNCFNQALYNSSVTGLLTGVDFSQLEVVNASPNCFYQAFYKTTGYTNGEMNFFPKLRWIQTSGNYDYGVFRQAFSNAVGITRAVFPELKIVAGPSTGYNYCQFNNTFNGVSGLTTIEFPKLKFLGCGLSNISNSMTNLIFGENLYALGVYGIFYLFNNKTGIDFTIPVEMLSTFDASIAYLGLSNSVVRFPVLGAVTNTSPIRYMLFGCDSVTVHFPIAMQSTVEGMMGYPDFSGTNTAVLFDLVYQVNDGTKTYTRFHNGYNTTSMGYQKDYIVVNGVTLYRLVNQGASWSNVARQIYTYWQAEGSQTKYITYNSEPSAGENIYTTSGAVYGTISSYVKDRVFVPIAAEPSVGNTLYSDEACTVVAGTVASIV